MSSSRVKGLMEIWNEDVKTREIQTNVSLQCGAV